MNIKKTFVHHSSSDAISTSATWLKIVYVGFALLAVSIIFHAWLFISSGEISLPSASVSSSSLAPINETGLNTIVSDYLSGQAQKISKSDADEKLSDPAK